MDWGKENTDEYVSSLSVAEIAHLFRDAVPAARSAVGRLAGGVQWTQVRAGPFAAVERQPDFAINAVCPMGRGANSSNVGYILKLAVFDEGPTRTVYIGSLATSQAHRPAATGARASVLARMRAAEAPRVSELLHNAGRPETNYAASGTESSAPQGDPSGHRECVFLSCALRKVSTRAERCPACGRHTVEYRPEQPPVDTPPADQSVSADAGGPGTGESDVAALIVQLEALHRAGVLDDAELAAKKEHLTQPLPQVPPPGWYINVDDAGYRWFWDGQSWIYVSRADA